jgi:hypothetical protein
MKRAQCLLNIIFLLFFFGVNYAQSSQIQMEPEIEKLLELHLSCSKFFQKTDGFRIQLIAVAGTNSLSRAEAVLAQYNENITDIPAYISYQEPNFRVRAGNYRTRLDAMKDLARIKLIFPGAFIVKDEVFFN